jgi:hypothetical protein
MEYARTDIDTKRQALSQVFPEVIPPPQAGRIAAEQLDVVKWMRRL